MLLQTFSQHYTFRLKKIREDYLKAILNLVLRSKNFNMIRSMHDYDEDAMKVVEKKMDPRKLSVLLSGSCF